jgi:hypothetical protein
LGYQKTGEYFKGYINSKKASQVKKPVKSSDFWTPEVRAKLERQIEKSLAPPSWEAAIGSMIAENQPKKKTAAKSGNPLNPLDFILAGKAIFTVENEKTGNRLTFRFDAHKSEKDLFFVSVRAEGDFVYLGTVHGEEYLPGKKIPASDIRQKAFLWLWGRLKSNALQDFIKIEYERKETDF